MRNYCYHFTNAARSELMHGLYNGAPKPLRVFAGLGKPPSAMTRSDPDHPSGNQCSIVVGQGYQWSQVSTNFVIHRTNTKLTPHGARTHHQR